MRVWATTSKEKKKNQDESRDLQAFSHPAVALFRVSGANLFLVSKNIMLRVFFFFFFPHNLDTLQFHSGIR